MNIEKIKKKCIASGQMLLINAGKRQWIGTGMSMYRVEGVELSEEGLAAVFGLTPKEKAEMEIRQEIATERLCEALPDMAGGRGDELCERSKLEVVTRTGARFVQLIGKDTGRRVWADVSRFAPAAKKGSVFDIYLHGDVLLATNGMYVDAAILPEDTGTQREIETILDTMANGESMPEFDTEEEEEE